MRMAKPCRTAKPTAGLHRAGFHASRVLAGHQMGSSEARKGYNGTEAALKPGYNPPEVVKNGTRELCEQTHP